MSEPPKLPPGKPSSSRPVTPQPSSLNASPSQPTPTSQSPAGTNVSGLDLSSSLGFSQQLDLRPALPFEKANDLQSTPSARDEDSSNLRSNEATSATAASSNDNQNGVLVSSLRSSPSQTKLIQAAGLVSDETKPFQNAIGVSPTQSQSKIATTEIPNPSLSVENRTPLRTSPSQSKLLPPSMTAPQHEDATEYSFFAASPVKSRPRDLSDASRMAIHEVTQRSKADSVASERIYYPLRETTMMLKGDDEDDGVTIAKETKSDARCLHPSHGEQRDDADHNITQSTLSQDSQPVVQTSLQQAKARLPRLSTAESDDTTHNTTSQKPDSGTSTVTEPMPLSSFSTNSIRVTNATKSSDLSKVSVETLASLGGWTAKRVSVTGQLFFERDADGKIQIERPTEALYAVRQTSHEDGSEGEEEDRETPTSRSDTPVTLPSPSSSAVSQEKPIPLDEDTILRIQSMDGNARCVDCGSSGPSWASISFGVLLCMNCSATHRSFGSHITVVKSLTLDNWTGEQLSYMSPHGGNDRFKLAVKSDGKPSARYATEDAALYRLKLRALVKGEPLPTSITPATAMRMLSGVSPRSSPTSPLHSPARKAMLLQNVKEAQMCSLCGRTFNVVIRKHYCRNCNRAVCSRCAPAGNTKPLPHLGLGMAPQRHCSKCYRSPFLDWSTMGLSSAEQAAEAEVAAEVPLQRRKTIGEKKVRRKTIGDAIAGLMKRG